MSETQLKTGYPPFIHANVSVEKLMYYVAFFLLLPCIGAIYFFGMKALIIIISSVVSAIVFDLLMKYIRKKPLSLDGSEIVTGILLALILPPEIPFYIPITGSAFGIIIVKHVFGGLGNNVFNPALAARAFIGASWPLALGAYSEPAKFLSDKWLSFNLDNSLITSATPLARDSINLLTSRWSDLINPLIGNIPGSIGETSAVLLIIAGVIMLLLKIIDWRITLSYIGIVLIGGGIYGAYLGFNVIYFGLYSILTGGLLIGAIFMATDYVTSPSTKKGRIIFGIGCGALTLIFRIFSQMPEGVMYSILLMNAITPLIDRYTFPKPFGWKKPNKIKQD